MVENALENTWIGGILVESCRKCCRKYMGRLDFGRKYIGMLDYGRKW